MNKLMKYALPVLFLMGLPPSISYAAAPATMKLTPQTSSALPAHLTTRIQWVRFPQPVYKDEDLKGQDRHAIIRIYADETGKVNKAAIQESTGIKTLDDILLTAVQQAQVKAYIENDTALPVIGYQAFSLKLDDNADQDCLYNFNSENWLAQQQHKKVPFQYLNQPQLEINRDQLNGYDRSIKFSFKSNKHGNIKKVKIQQGSGTYALDQAVIQAVSQVQISTPRKFWIYKKSHFKDQIYFKLEECQ